MASTKEIRRRIKSVKNIAQITRAMQMVSATKMRRAQNQTLSARPYTTNLSQVLSLIVAGNQLSHPLLSVKDSGNIGVLVLTSDKGLCGALNTNVIRTLLAADFFKNPETVFFTVGRKGRDFLLRSGKTIEADFENKEKVTFADAVKIRRYLLPAFLKSSFKEVYLVYPHFVTTLRQEVKVVKLLPIQQENLRHWLVESGAESEKFQEEIIFEPTKQAILEFTLIHFIDSQIYQALLETKASEHSARMIAMQNATDNAKDIVQDLTLTYNGLRQESITREILEITSAQAALE